MYNQPEMFSEIISQFSYTVFSISTGMRKSSAMYRLHSHQHNRKLKISWKIINLTSECMRWVLLVCKQHYLEFHMLFIQSFISYIYYFFLLKLEQINPCLAVDISNSFGKDI